MPTPPAYEERNHNLVTFNQALQLQQTSSHAYAANIHPHWSFTPAAHGGYLIAAITEAVKLHFKTTLKHLDQPDSFSIHYEFLMPVGVGKVDVEVTDLRLGKGTSTVQFLLKQGKKGEVRGSGFVSNCGPKANRNTPSVDMGYTSQPAFPSISFSDVLAGKDPHWIRYDIPLTPTAPDGALGQLVFAMRREPQLESEKRYTQQWISPRHPDQNWTTEMLGILLDSSAPVPETFLADNIHAVPTMAARAVSNEREGKTSWDHPSWGVPRYYPTKSMNVEIKRQLPPEGEKWLALRWHTREVVDGRWDAEIEIWDPKGRLIAVALAVSFMVDIARSPASRAKKQEKSSKI